MFGPLDAPGQSSCGVLDEDLGRAALAALEIPRDRCRAYAARLVWSQSTHQFLDEAMQGGTAQVRLPNDREITCNSVDVGSNR